MTQPDLVVLTGASGFIALHCVKALLEDGYRVRGTIRSLAKESDIRAALELNDDQQSRLSFCAVDLLNDEGWDEAMRGARFLMHVASPFPASTPKDERDVLAPAIEGTLRVLGAAVKAGIEKTVLTSSIVAIMHNDKRYSGGLVTEEDWSDPDRGIPVYDRSKTLAERAAWDFVEKSGTTLVALNPTFVIGPSLLGTDNTSNEVVAKLLRKDIPGVPRWQVDMVDVRDVAIAHLLALKNPAADGKRFILVSESCWYKDVALTLRSAGFDVPTRQFPDFVIKLVAVFDKTVALIIPELGVKSRYSSQQAQEVLGWKGRAMSEMVLDTARTHQAHV